jgi:copper resistance protein B
MRSVRTTLVGSLILSVALASSTALAVSAPAPDRAAEGNDAATEVGGHGGKHTESATGDDERGQGDASGSADAASPDDAAVTPEADAQGSASAAASPRTEEELEPSLPEGMTLDQVLARAAHPPPENFPDAINDDRLLAFLLVDQLEYRVAATGTPSVLGWRAHAWLGGDLNRLVLKPEGQATFEKTRGFEAETDLRYGRLLTPFWSAQIGGQYANKWAEGDGYTDRWSGAIAMQGLAPGKFDVDLTAYVSEKGDFTSKLELEYDWRITQRLVAQPRTELTVAFQDVPDRNMSAGLTDVVGALRIRYELKREFAPYLGVRYRTSVFDSVDRARAAGKEPARFFFVAGVRVAFR